jgi:hypothetical protein
MSNIKLHLRPAAASDARIVWEWRNEAHSRAAEIA